MIRYTKGNVLIRVKGLNVKIATVKSLMKYTKTHVFISVKKFSVKCMMSYTKAHVFISA